MKKDYSDWHNLKTQIENDYDEKLFREREIWWCSLGSNIGYEQDGKNSKYERPILVIRKFNKGIFLGVPLTTKNKSDEFHFNFKLKNKLKSSVILSQIRLLSSKRLVRRIARLNENEFCKIKEKIKNLI